EWLAVGEHRLVVTGTYRGMARATGGVVEASFAHLWEARAGRLVALTQVTDTASWAAALVPAEPASPD
ncbi:MAG: hypothetical protein JWO02_3315, partial [Solirubrobacterales bacterium]|nr:hypothetical protein [Solirubrobacterales bacterium]